MQSHLIKLSVLLCVLPGFALACVSHDTRSTYAGKTTTKKLVLCYQSDWQLFTSSCAGRKKCLAQQQVDSMLPTATPLPLLEIGTPASALCRHLGGTFKLIQVKRKQKWAPSNLCEFKDGSFVSGFVLVRRNFRPEVL